MTGAKRLPAIPVLRILIMRTVGVIGLLILIPGTEIEGQTVCLARSVYSMTAIPRASEAFPVRVSLPPEELFLAGAVIVALD